MCLRRRRCGMARRIDSDSSYAGAPRPGPGRGFRRTDRRAQRSVSAGCALQARSALIGSWLASTESQATAAWLGGACGVAYHHNTRRDSDTHYRRAMASCLTRHPLGSATPSHPPGPTHSESLTHPLNNPLTRDPPGPAHASRGGGPGCASSSHFLGRFFPAVHTAQSHGPGCGPIIPGICSLRI